MHFRGLRWTPVRAGSSDYSNYAAFRCENDTGFIKLDHPMQGVALERIITVLGCGKLGTWNGAEITAPHSHGPRVGALFRGTVRFRYLHCVRKHLAHEPESTHLR